VVDEHNLRSLRVDGLRLSGRASVGHCA
jgi:hypothetical protein